jgi:hypothetical protein
MTSMFQQKGEAAQPSILGMQAAGRPRTLLESAPSPPQPNKPAGLIEAGNIDLTARPVVKQANGKIATVKSASVDVDGKEVLIPTIADDGTELTIDQAEERYRKTGKHLGIFDTPQNATTYGKQLSAEQGRMYGAPK